MAPYLDNKIELDSCLLIVKVGTTLKYGMEKRDLLYTLNQLLPSVNSRFIVAWLSGERS